MQDALLVAIKKGNIDQCRAALDAGADENAMYGSVTPLEEAVSCGDFDIASFLIERGADVNCRFYGKRRPLLQTAAKNGRVELCRLLVEQGFPLDEPTSTGWTALNLAAYGGHAEAVSLLIKTGAKIDGASVFRATIRGSQDVAVCRALVDSGVSPSFSPDKAERDYLTPIQDSIESDAEAIFKFFVEECGEPIEQVALDGRATVDLMKKSPRVAACIYSMQTQGAVSCAVGNGQEGESERPRSRNYPAL